ncbi:MAG: hypothetical protein ISN64_02380 [Rickettsia sp.]|nr:hypothetical protein [Rickettsia sp.]
MLKTLYKISAPATLMLTGEHSVLYGKKSVISSINKRITVSLSKRNDDLIIIESKKNFFFETKILDIKILKNFELLTSILHFYKNFIQSGFKIEITSDIPQSKGLGSSTALLVSCVGLMKLFISHNNPNIITNKQEKSKDFLDKIFSDSKKILELSNTIFSGADIIASLKGGIILYEQHKLLKRTFKNLNLLLIYSGYKTKTSDVISYIQPIREKFLDIFRGLENTIDKISELAFKAIEENNLDYLGKLFTLNQGILESMMLSSPLINYLINRLKDFTYIKGVKISGAGLGDSIIALTSTNKDINKLPTDLQKIAFQNIKISNIGLKIE